MLLHDVYVEIWHRNFLQGFEVAVDAMGCFVLECLVEHFGEMV